MELMPADYAILVTSGVAGVWGLFSGFSGALAFLAGTVAGVVAGRCGWALSPNWFSSSWGQALASLAVGLVAFGLARVLVRKVVHGILAQPGDAIFGSMVASVAGFALAVGAVFLAGYADLADWPSSLVDLVTGWAGIHARG